MATDDTAGDDWYSEDAATFGDRLAAARESQGLDQRGLAGRLGVKLSTVQRWEDDQSEPRANKLIALAGILNVSMPWLLTGEGEGLDGPGSDRALPADLQGLMAEMRALQATMRHSAAALARLEKRLRAALAGRT